MKLTGIITMTVHYSLCIPIESEFSVLTLSLSVYASIHSVPFPQLGGKPVKITKSYLKIYVCNWLLLN